MSRLLSRSLFTRATKVFVIAAVFSFLFSVLFRALNSSYAVYASNATIKSNLILSNFINPYEYRRTSIDTSQELPAAQLVSVITKNSSQTVFTQYGNVAEVLNSLKIKYSDEDIVIPALDEEIAHTGKIRVVYVDRKMDEESSMISFDTKVVEDPNLELGKEKVVQQGVLGAFTSRYELTYKDGELVDRKLVDSFVSEQPQSKIIAKGTKIIRKRVTLPDGSQFTYCETKSVKVTAYDPSCTGCSNRTALGYELKRGVIAVDPNVIPFHTEMYVPGYGVGVALDTGGVIKGDFIDVGYASAQERGQNWAGTRLNHTIYLACPS